MTFYIAGYKIKTKKGIVIKLCGNIVSAIFWKEYYWIVKGEKVLIVEWFVHGDNLS